MSLQIIQEKLDSYQCKTEQEETNALKEITQELALAALARSNFFKTAVFQGGTCLRILYGLDRFSEDLDFVLKEPSSAFSFEPFLASMKLEFEAYGYHLQVQDRKQVDKAVKNIFLKDASIGKLLSLNFNRPRINPLPIKVKLEVDTNPPAGSAFEDKYLDFPFPSAIIVQDLPSLFAGKMHALLCRDYIKGRDWYDFAWYVSRKTPLNFALLSNALDQAGPWKGQSLRVDKDWVLTELAKKIRSIRWRAAQDDVRRFIKPNQIPSIELWGEPFFLDRLEKLRTVL
jgi:predicted nucleotidyltransferase component of viral defense system